MAFHDWDIVVVSHNSESHLHENWITLPQDLRARVTVVDNGSTQDHRKIFGSAFGRVLCTINRGLAHGNNLGADAGSARYVLYCNPDVKIVPGDLEILGSHLDMFGGLVGPALADTDGRVQESARGWPTIPRQLANRLGAGSGAYLRPAAQGTRAPVPWLLGAAVGALRQDITALGGWPTSYFLYFEDTELCLRSWKRNFPVWYIGDVKWTHSWARASRSFRSPSTRLHAGSALKFYRQHPELLFVVPATLKRAVSAGVQTVAEGAESD